MKNEKICEFVKKNRSKSKTEPPISESSTPPKNVKQAVQEQGVSDQEDEYEVEAILDHKKVLVLVSNSRGSTGFVVYEKEDARLAI